MKKWFKKSALVCLAISLLMTLMPIGSAAAATASLTNSSIPNGEYPVDFNFLEDGKTSVSTANMYMKIPGTKGKLIVQNGVIWFEHEIETDNLNHFKYLGYRPEGVPKATIVNSVIQDKTGYIDAAVSNGAGASRKIVRHGISDISKLQDIVMHIDIPNIQYNHWYHAQISIDTSQLPGNGGGNPGNGGPVVGPVTLDKLNELITVTQSVYNSSVEGPDLGQFPVGSRDVLNVAIVKAEADLAKANPGDEAAYGAIYTELNQQLTHFRSLQRQSNKTVLKGLIASMTTFLSTATSNGQANGIPGSAFAGIVEGEYPHEYISALQEKVALGIQIVANPTAAQTEIDKVSAAMNYNYDMAINHRYVANEPFRLYVLDTPNETKTESVYVGLVNPAVTTITELANKDTLGGVRANITLNVTPDENKVYWFMPWNDGTYKSPDEFEQINMLSAVTIHPNRPRGETVYQWTIKNPDANKDTQWTGLGHITFKVNGVKHSLYLSFNRIIHERLQQSLASAQQTYNDAPKLPNVDQAEFDKAKASLLTAIQEAKPVSENLNAERPAILNAETKLKAAFDAFKVLAQVEYELYFSAVHANEEAFSPIDGKFVKPAQVIPQQNGKQVVRFTVNDSSSIKELQVAAGGVFENVKVVSENAAANSRVIQFAVSDLSQLVKARVKVVTSGQGNPTEEIHDIRFNFNGVNNTALQAAISDASTLLRNAVTGINPGQYPESAKTALSTAIRTAGKVAVNGANTNDKTAAALTALQAAVQTFKASIIPGVPLPIPGVLKDGYYLVHFSILKNGTETPSIANTYIVSPALLHVVGTSRTVSFTVKRSKEINTLTINGSSGSVVNVDHQKNTRVVAYTLPTLSGKHSGTVRIDWPEVKYHHTYDIQFAFNEATITSTNGPSVPGFGTDGNVSGPGLPLPGGGFPGKVNTDNGKKSGEGEKDKKAGETTEGSNGKGTVGNEEQSSFGDTKKHWAEKHIVRAVKLGVASGFKDGNFHPNKQITRAEFAAIISRALKLEGSASDSSFEDADKIPSWARKHVSLAVKNGLIVGYKDGTFQGNKTMTRAELAVIIARAVKLKVNEKASSTFADAKSIPSWAIKSVTAAVEAGLIKGKANNRFDPNATATRAEAVTLVLRMLDYNAEAGSAQK
ncbi:NEAT domain-containing protein [Paenibacillus sp. SC116]|uniref:NEAT domain-containing protein n=1 Tax=Paenibacillus sp. SC116 TaxID=2968986 RepID=UPI00215AF2D7|nr:NEAT domain-containing protein [Paenibacillus sp. SC116]MCR8844932.1 NEAT domain-containing protein [Paenibacillus sp. SC116]